MSYKDYRLYRTIQSPDFDSVNVLAFSKDCKLFAAGLENGAVITFHTDGGRQVAQYQKDTAAIDAILWSVGSDKDKDKDKLVLFVGTRTGKLFRYSRPDKKAKADRNIDWMASLEGPIRCIDYDSTNNYLIVGHGSQVSALRQNTLNDWRIVFDLKDPPFLMPTNFTCPPPFPTGVHVPRQNNTVIVSFLDHGIVCYGLDHGDVMWNITPERRIGNSATSTDGMMLVATNLYDGIDFYSCSTKRRGDRITDPILTNVIIPVRFIHDDEDILVGGSGGVASILNIAAKKSILTLKHSQTNDLIQSLAYTKLKGVKFIVTGNSEKGPDCKICLWVSYPPDWKPGPWYRIKSLWKTRDITMAGMRDGFLNVVYWVAAFVVAVFALSTAITLAQILATSDYNPVAMFNWTLNGTVTSISLGANRAAGFFGGSADANTVTVYAPAPSSTRKGR